MKKDWIDVCIAATSVVVDDMERYWIWDQKNSVIGYFVGNTYKFHVESRYTELPSSFQALDMYLQEDMIYIFSKSSIEVLSYDIVKKNFRMYRSDISLKSSQYCSFQKSENQIIFVPFELKAPFIEFDMDKKEFREKCVLAGKRYDKNIMWRLEDCGKEVLLPVFGTGDILIFDKDNYLYRKITLPYSRNIQCTCEGKQHEIWASMCDRKGLIRYFDGCEEIIQLEENEKCNEPFSKLLYYQNKVIALPRYAQDIYIYDTLEKHIQKLNLFENIDIPQGTASLIWEGFFRENKLICLPWRCPVVCEIDLSAYHCYYKKVKIGEQDYFMQICDGIIEENEKVGLEKFIHFVNK